MRVTNQSLQSPSTSRETPSHAETSGSWSPFRMLIPSLRRRQFDDPTTVPATVAPGCSECEETQSENQS
ncbi:hypothetical protein EVAR_82771_1 [Eumeta japonica]|uniref:Uncharacterized protein n=1 Tax=Eumeta variegata TaxID=151549 RepID=A0A4C1UMQ4_EUMVA|nr:hypothetical protein EVAR_82771_1 [Eumeta japonica]